MSRHENAGKLVQLLTTGKKGRTFNREAYINGKIPVYFMISESEKTFEEKAVLCNVANLKLIGYID